MGGISQPNVGVGINQTWQNVLASRAFGITYTNTTGKPILVSCSSVNGSVQNCAIQLDIDGVTLGKSGSANGNAGASIGCISGIVPVNSTYVLTNLGTGTLNVWAELR